jgi:hypothetical protein
MVDVRKDQLSFEFIGKERRQPKPKNVARRQGKDRRKSFTREESAHILGMRYERMDDRDD